MTGKQRSPAEAKLAVVIMAAGKGTRLRSRRPKALHQVGGRALLQHVIAATAGIVDRTDIFVVVGHEAEKVRAAVADTGVRFVEQREQRGTGHAIQCAREAIAGYENVVVLSGDVPLIRPETIEQVWHFHEAEDAAMTILTAAPENPRGYGRIMRKAADEADVEAIVEQVNLTPQQEGIREINSGIYTFKTKPLLAHLDELSASNPQGEVIPDRHGSLCCGPPASAWWLCARRRRLRCWERTPSQNWWLSMRRCARRTQTG